ncbi:hypothetical protein AB4225_29045 [Streptomyces sp. 2RAF24]|uniref:hypothetical protein n=1 Tax=Streptomyces sp. 2RAF24 TaxID=3232997 RepID=UPI003F9B4F4E
MSRGTWAFDYLLTLQIGGGAAVAGRAEAAPELETLLLDDLEFTWGPRIRLSR